VLTSRIRAGEDGMTIIEVLVAMVVLVVGVLALLTLLSDSFRTTSQTTAREQGTNVARDVVERARQVSYASTTTSATTSAAIAATLPETPAVTGSAFTMTRRGTTYAVTITACSIDDPADGEGVGAASANFCAAPTSTTVPGSPPVGTGVVVGPSVLGLPVTLAIGGSLITTVCQAVGTDTAVGNAVAAFGASLLSVAGNGAQLSICPLASGGSIAYDTKPDDLRRIKVAVAWTRAGTTSSLTQTTLLTTPA